MGQLWAHSANEAGERHALADHLRGTATLAGEFAAAFGAEEAASYLGLVHDVGKGACAWQAKLLAVEGTESRVGVDHKSAGTWLAEREVGPLAAAVYGHHGGLPSRADLKKVIRYGDGEGMAEIKEVVEKVAAVVPEVRPAARPRLPAWFVGERRHDRHVLELLVRLTFSALVDADYLDTNRHFTGEERIPHPLSAAELPTRFDAARAAYLADAAPSPVDALRQEVYEQAVAAASGPPGVYRMAAPTGSGKTLAAMGFALRHAYAHRLRRVVVAVPFMSITEQNAAVYRTLLDRAGEPPVALEHHSGVDLDASRSKHDSRWRRLAAENWDAPVIVTTTVQLFQSLFDRRPAAMRKLHRLAGSVIVLDEVQALPDRLLLPILSALRTLTECFGVTVLLASATQPTYWALKPFRGLAVRDIISDPAPLYTALNRVRYEWRPSMAIAEGGDDLRPTLEEIASEAASERQVLVVVNTTRDSAALHEHLERHRDPTLGPCLHLSTRMAARHRRDVLAEVRGCLAAGDPVAVVSTQLVEAGVDLDFPVVYRAFAPADSLQQAAGRANRNGRLPYGRVVVFDPADGGQPGDSSYTAAVAATRAHIGPGRAGPDDRAALARYYPQRYALQNLEDDRGNDGVVVQKFRAELDFPRVAEHFRLIDEHTVPVVVPYGPEEDRARVERLIDRLRSGAPGAPDDLRHLQPYTATLPVRLARQAEGEGLAEPVVGDLLEWLGPYHPQRGLVYPDPSAQDSPEELVW